MTQELKKAASLLMLARCDLWVGVVGALERVQFYQEEIERYEEETKKNSQ